MPGRNLRPAEFVPEPGAGKAAPVPRQLRGNGIVHPADGQPGRVEVMQIGQRRHLLRRMAKIEGTGLPLDQGPASRRAGTQRIGLRIVSVVDRDRAAPGRDLERAIEEIRPEGRMMPPHHVDGLCALHAKRFRDDKRVTFHGEHALHLHRHGVKSPRQPKTAGAGLPAPRADRGLAMEAVEHAVNRAGIAAVRKQQRPAAGVARQPLRLVARREAGDGERNRVPGHPSEHGQSRRTMNDLRDGAAHVRAHGDPDLVRRDRDLRLRIAHLMAPAMRPRMKCFWKTM